jgi:hypothetical protein
MNSVNAPKPAGFDLAGSMSEAEVRIIRQIGAELRKPAATAMDPSRTVRPQRQSDVGNTWHRSRQHQ